MTDKARNGRIITFYSYKGGTGRSMALANVGWILAATGRRVLLIDWDLEAPGLHRYLHPFIEADKELTSTPGLIDFFVDFSTAARTARADGDSGDGWFESFASIVRYASPIGGGFANVPLEFVTAGRQDAGYAVLVTSFNWQEFYDKLGGGVFLEALKRRLRHDYDFVLIDSRTGISDTSGICTVQMPDELVVLYTLNQQSIKGAAAVAESADRLRRKSSGEPGLRIWPVPTRVELAEKDRLDAAREVSRQTFERYIGHLPRKERSRYWERVEVLYQPYYAYEEVLATFADRARQPNSMLARMEVIAGLLAREAVELPRMREETRLATKKAFERPTKTARPADPNRRAFLFVSYSQRDLRVIEPILERLRTEGVDLWIDRQNMPLGFPWRAEIPRAIADSAAMLFFIGPEPPSEWRQQELSMAREANLPIVPVLLQIEGPVNLPLELRDFQAVTLDSSSPEGIEILASRLVPGIRHFLAASRMEDAAFDPDDPQKGRWGGLFSLNERELVASVREVSEDFFEVTLEVRSIGSEPLSGEVTLHLHPTFAKPVQTVPVVDGRAALRFLCWGAFTVGAVMDNGKTSLELDLAANTEFPAKFIER